MDTTRTPRILTHDERKAAEAAFSGRPFNPTWSESAKKVYEGLIQALPGLPDELVVTDAQHAAVETSPTEAAATLPTTEAPTLEGSTDSGQALDALTDTPVNQLLTNR